MLVLSRKVGQSLVIAQGVTVTVSEIGPDYVRLTVEAPNEPDVRRRYPQSLDVPQAEAPSEPSRQSERPIVVTLTLHDAALLDRLRRRMAGEEQLPPSRDAALGAILQAVAEEDNFPLPRLTGIEPSSRPQPVPQADGSHDGPSRRRSAVAGGKPR